eukprot:10107065-Heterocapsa_arctica.AAC.1
MGEMCPMAGDAQLCSTRPPLRDPARGGPDLQPWIGPVSMGQSPGQHSHQLRIITLNSNAWTTAKKFINSTTADVLLLQEHADRLTMLDEASQWAKDNGWANFWTPALPGVVVGT